YAYPTMLRRWAARCRWRRSTATSNSRSRQAVRPAGSCGSVVKAGTRRKAGAATLSPRSGSRSRTRSRPIRGSFTASWPRRLAPLPAQQKAGQEPARKPLSSTDHARRRADRHQSAVFPSGTVPAMNDTRAYSRSTPDSGTTRVSRKSGGLFLVASLAFLGTLSLVTAAFAQGDAAPAVEAGPVLILVGDRVERLSEVQWRFDVAVRS